MVFTPFYLHEHLVSKISDLKFSMIDRNALGAL